MASVSVQNITVAYYTYNNNVNEIICTEGVHVALYCETFVLNKLKKKKKIK